MSNEEIIDEILHEAAALKIREEVLEFSSKLQELNPRMSRVEAFEIALKHLKGDL